MNPKEDPLEQQRPHAQTLWLEGDSMVEAREGWWQAFQEERNRHMLHDEADKRVWDIAWAATIAAHSYLTEGRIKPR